MSSRPAGTTAFDNLKPTILRQPARPSISHEAESKLLDTQHREAVYVNSAPQQSLPEAREDTRPQAFAGGPGTPFGGANLLTKKRREVLIPVTFRMPQTLKQRLEKVASAHEINQTDLINEAIELNLQRYM